MLSFSELPCFGNLYCWNIQAHSVTQLGFWMSPWSNIQLHILMVLLIFCRLVSLIVPLMCVALLLPYVTLGNHWQLNHWRQELSSLTGQLFLDCQPTGVSSSISSGILYRCYLPSTGRNRRVMWKGSNYSITKLIYVLGRNWVSSVRIVLKITVKLTGEYLQIIVSESCSK